MFWLIVLGLTVLAGILGAVYLIVAVGRFAPISRIEKRWKRLLLSSVIILTGFIIAALTMTFLNAVIVMLHVLVFFLVFGLAIRIISKFGKLKQGIYWQGWLALLTALVYLSIGHYLCFNVWRTDYNLTTDKDTEPVKIALFADSHLSTTFDGEGFARHIEEIKAQSPDVVLIAGDFIDDGSKREDILRACRALGSINAKYGVFFAYGNHDRGYYNSRDFSEDELVAELENNNVTILKDEHCYVGDMCIIGRDYSSTGDRKSMEELREGIDPSTYVVVMDHVPSDYENEAGMADLVVSGHTHGGQLIPITYVGEWLGLNDRTYGYEQRNGTDFIVTSGISDWAVHFKTGTKSEYVIISVNNPGR